MMKSLSLAFLCLTGTSTAFMAPAAFNAKTKGSSTTLASSYDRSVIDRPYVADDIYVPSRGVSGGLSPYYGGAYDSYSGTGGQMVRGRSRSRTANGGLDNQEVWDTLAYPSTIQGGSLRTWSFQRPRESVEVLLKSDGRPLHADVQLGHGPDNVPQRVGVYMEDGGERTFRAVIMTPRVSTGSSDTLAIRNTGVMEFPLYAGVVEDGTYATGVDLSYAMSSPRRTLQGGAVHTYPFDYGVSSVMVVMQTDGRPLNARIELLNGPNRQKEVIEVYCEDGMERPFIAILETPQSGNVVRIVNTATVEFPISASVEPYSTGDW